MLIILLKNLIIVYLCIVYIFTWKDISAYWFGIKLNIFLNPSYTLKKLV